MPQWHVHFTPERFSVRLQRLSKCSVMLVVEVIKYKLIVPLIQLPCLFASLLALTPHCLHAWTPFPMTNKHPNIIFDFHPCTTHTLPHHNACQEGFFLSLWCMPPLNPIIITDCNRHFCSQSSFYFVQIKKTILQWSHFMTYTHAVTSAVSSTLTSGLPHPDCSHIFTTYKGLQLCQSTDSCSRWSVVCMHWNSLFSPNTNKYSLTDRSR